MCDARDGPEGNVMQKKTKLERAASISYLCVTIVFLLVFLYMALFENVSVFAARDERTYTVVDDYTVREIEDPQAPAGIRREYSWVLGDIGTNENSLGFYLIHHYAQVYFDDELVYSLTPDEGNRITRGVSSNWVLIPIYPEDSGKQVRVVATPAYRNVENREIEFSIGSRYSISFNQLKKDLSKLILSALCIVIGAIIMLVQFILILRKRTKNWSVFWLGCFSTMLGLWKITDTRFSPIMFSGNPLVLGYITIGMIYLCTLPPLFYERAQTPARGERYITVEILALCAVAFAVMLCQVLGIAELKETLVVSHFLIIIETLTVLLAILRRRKYGIGDRSRKDLFFILFLVFGVLLDFLVYYVKKNSSNLIFTMLSFLVYTVIEFVRNFADISRRARTDAQTGFFNRSHWNQLMNEHLPEQEPIGIIMFDLNRLKYTNDTMGHEAGDKMILSFSNILRNTIPHSNTICRWGGDEFTVMVTDASREKMEAYLANVKSAADVYNASGEKPRIHYAAGYALSSQFPGITRRELMQKADAQMYLDKQRWYRENLNTRYRSSI